MSSFIVSQKHAITTAKALDKEYNDLSYSVKNHIESKYESAMAFMGKVWAMNHISNFAQYPQHYYENGNLVEPMPQAWNKKQIDSALVLSLHGLYNALRCIMYNSEWENVRDSSREFTKLTDKQVDEIEDIGTTLGQVLDSIAAKIARIASENDSTCKWEVE